MHTCIYIQNTQIIYIYFVSLTHHVLDWDNLVYTQPNIKSVVDCLSVFKPRRPKLLQTNLRHQSTPLQPSPIRDFKNKMKFEQHSCTFHAHAVLTGECSYFFGCYLNNPLPHPLLSPPILLHVIKDLVAKQHPTGICNLLDWIDGVNWMNVNFVGRVSQRFLASYEQTSAWANR